MKLLDRMLAPFRRSLTPAEPVELLAPAGRLATGTGDPLYRQVAVSYLFDFMAGVPDPDEVLRRTGRTRADLRQLLRDAEVSQALDTRREAVIATPWRLESGERLPADDAGADTPLDFVYRELAAHMPRIIYGNWQAVPYGYSVIEAIYGRRGARIGLDRISLPPFEWFRPLQDGTLRYFPIDGSGGFHGLDCDPRKFMLTTRNAELMNPYGESLLSVLYWPVTWRLQGWQLWLNFLETFGSPIMVGKVANYDKFIDAMARQGVARAVGWQPSSDKEDIQAITASTPGEFERLNDSLGKTIAKVVLGQTLTSDVGKTGSFAAAKVHNEVRNDKRRADLRVVSAGAQHLVDALWSINRFPGMPPQFVMQDDVGLERDRADRDVVLSSMGIRFKKPYFVERYDLEDPDFDVVEPPVAPTAPGDQPIKPAGVKPRESVKQSSADGERFTPEQQVLERGITELVAAAPPTIDRSRLLSVIRGARDQADLADRLAILIDKQDPAYAEILARALFVAKVIGYVHAVEAPATP